MRAPELTEQVRAFLAHGLMLDPWFADLTSEHFAFDAQDVLAAAAAAQAAHHWNEAPPADVFGDLSAPAGFGRLAALETLNSTASVIAHQVHGKARVERTIAEEAVSRLERFVASSGFAALVRVYLVIATSENQAALAHYGAIPEEDFVRGVLHRPWLRGSLAGELQFGLAAGEYRIALENGRRWVEQTEDGRKAWASAHEVLAASGYLKEHLRLTEISQFDLMINYDRDFDRGFPDHRQWRRSFTRFAAVRAGSRLIEVGCGTGTQTFEGGLHAAVGSSGKVVGLDPSLPMLAHASRKASEYGATNIEFVQGRAEAIPFADGTFDAAVAMGSLQFTEAPRAIAEMMRVTRGSGCLAAGSGSQVQSDEPWFVDWFGPLLDLMAKRQIDARGSLTPYGGLSDVFHAAGLEHVESERRIARTAFAGADIGVTMVLDTLPRCQEALQGLPWAARHELMRELSVRGEAVCRRTTLEQRTTSFPTEHVRGVVSATRSGPGESGPGEDDT